MTRYQSETIGATTYPTGVYLLEKADPVLGDTVALGGVANQPLQDLANRTLWLKNHLAAIAVGMVWTEVVQTAGGNWTAPAGVTKVLIIEAVGAGGGGCGQFATGPANGTGAGGGEGARITNQWLTVVPTTVYALGIGAGGAGGTGIITGAPVWASTVLGANGGDTTFGALLTLQGGRGGGSTVPTIDSFKACRPGVGGAVTIGGVVYQGETGNHGSGIATYTPPKGGGALGGDWLMASGTVAPGLGCGGCGGVYDYATTTSYPNGTAGGAGLIRFGYFSQVVTGNT